MTRSGFEYILAKHVAVAAQCQASIIGKRVTPHVLRHSCAMHTLQATGDVRKVALWLGHASLQSTEIYLRADPTEKLAALASMAPLGLQRGRFQAPDKLLGFSAEHTPANHLHPSRVVQDGKLNVHPLPPPTLRSQKRSPL